MVLRTKEIIPPGVAFQRKLDFAVTPRMVAPVLTKALKSKGVLGSRKLCQNCAKWSPQWKHTHNTKDCRKWDAQGTPLDRQAKNIHAHTKDNGTLMECFQQMRKDNQKLMKALTEKKKRARKSKKRRVLESDSSDSDSE